MADRHTLHKSKLPAFIEWFNQWGMDRGWEKARVRPDWLNVAGTFGEFGPWQLVKLRDGKRTYAIYARQFMPEHVTVPKCLFPVLKAFMG